MAESSEVSFRRKCLYCDSTFRDNFNVRRHINSRHPEKANDITRINCDLCGLIYIRRKHDIPAVEMCEECKKKNDYRPPETFKFKDEEEFRIWKEKLEVDTSTRYFKSKRTYSTEYGSTKAEYPCYHSTFISSKNKRLQTPTNSSIKKGSACPAKMICDYASNGSVAVSFFSDHRGHDFDANEEFDRAKKRDPVPIKRERMSPGGLKFESYIDVGHDSSLHSISMESLPEEYYNNISLDESLSNHYNNDLEPFFNQIENEGQLSSSNNFIWPSSFNHEAENLASNPLSQFASRSVKSPFKKVLRDNNIPENPSYEAQTSNKMTEEERQSIMRMVLEDF